MSNEQQTRAPMNEALRDAFAAAKADDLFHWRELSKQVRDYTTAKFIVEYLDQNPKAKERMGGVYIRARVTVQRSRVRYAKRLRLKAFLLRWLEVARIRGKHNDQGHQDMEQGKRAVQSATTRLPEILPEFQCI